MLRYARLPGVACIRKIKVPGSRINNRRTDSGETFHMCANSFTE